MKLVDIDPSIGLLSATASVGLSSGTGGVMTTTGCGWDRDRYNTYFVPEPIELNFNADPIKIDYSKLFGIAAPKKVIFNPPATIVIWKDGTKTVVKCKDSDIFEPWTGFAMCICKRIFGDEFHSTFRKYCDGFTQQ